MIEEIIATEFFASLESLSIFPRQGKDLHLIMDGKIHRFSTDEDRGGEKSGGYYIHSDGWPNWGVQDFRKHSEMQKFKLSHDIMPQHWEIKSDSSKQRQEEQKRETEEARKRAYDEYSRADSKGAISHPYCRLKRVEGVSSKLRIVTIYNRKKDDFCRVGDLLIPLVNSLTRKFQTLQRISFNLMHNGKHMKGIYGKTKLEGACFEFLPTDYGKSERIIICEGYATGASIFKSARIKSIVLAAMSCNNILNVAKSWRNRLKVPVIIAADNDERGLSEARKTLDAGLADKIFVPPIIGIDWNDYINAKEK